MGSADEDWSELMQSATAGDERAVEELLERYWPDLRAYLARHAGQGLKDREGVSDLAQSVCREVLVHLRDGRFRFRGEAPFRQWLYRAAVMKMLVRHRHWQAARRNAGGERAAIEAERSPAAENLPATPSEEAVLHEEIERFERCFAALPEKHRDVIVWHHLDGLSHAQIAERLDCSESYSRALLSRALARLAALGVGTL